MNIITGYLATTEGTVTVNGKDIQKEPEAAKKSIGYLPELPPLYVDMTVEEYLKFVAELKKVPKAERKKQIGEVMEMTHITDKKDRLIKNLSKGYRQRVGLAQAILGYPEVIILDEPTVGLDPKQIIEIRDLIKELGKNHTIILSSHILSEVSAVCDHIMIIAHGKLVASDSPEGLQKLMSGSSEVILTIKGAFEDAEKVLHNIPHVEKVENKGEDKDHCAQLSITSADNVDIREEVFYALADAKLPILSMSHMEKSLEDIFLELTQDVTQDVQPAEEPQRKLLGGRHTKKVSEEGTDAESADTAEVSEEAEKAQENSERSSTETTAEEGNK